MNTKDTLPKFLVLSLRPYYFYLIVMIINPLVKKGIYLFKTDPNTAELIKHSSNAYLANKIAFINELSDLCEEVGANVKELSVGIGLDKRIGQDFLKVGPGFGGSCFPKDIKSLRRSFHKNKVESKILDAVISSNDVRFEKIVKKIKGILGEIKDKVLCVLGLAFKANTDDIRESPAIKIVELLLKFGAKIQAYDPKAKFYSKDIAKKIILCKSSQDAMNGADAIIIATEWDEFKSISFSNTNVIIDLRNLLEVNNIQKSEIQYHCLGVKTRVDP